MKIVPVNCDNDLQFILGPWKKPVTCNNLLSILYIIHFKLQNWTALDVRDGFAEILSCVFVFVLWIFLLTKHHKFQCILLLLPLMLLDNKDYLHRAPHWPSSGSSPPSQGCSIRPLSRHIIQLLLSYILFKEPHFHFQSLLSHNFKNPYQGLKCDLKQKCKTFWKLSRHCWCWRARQSDKYPNHGNEGQLRETQDQMQIHMQISIQTQIT